MIEKEKIGEICQKAVDKYGHQSQIDMAIEEMAELADALMKFRRGRVTEMDVATEIADVFIMAYQMSLIFGREDVVSEVERKLLRLQDRMNK